jgi:putative ABC transport system permease protein
MLSDLTAAVRTLLRRRGLTAVAVVSLALVIGTGTAEISYLSFLLWAGLPVPHPRGLVALAVSSPSEPSTATSYPDYLDYRDQNDVLTGLAARGVFGTTAETGGDTVHVWGHLVSGNYFAILGAAMHLGRGLDEADDRPGAERVAVLSHTFWRQACRGEPAILGRTIRLNGQPFTVVGVAPEDFRGDGVPADLYVPLAQQAAVRLSRHEMLTDRGFGWLSLVGRLRPGVGLDHARAALNIVTARLRRESPDRPPRRVDVYANDHLVGAGDRSELLPRARRIGAFVGILVLLGCANVANLLVSNTAGRLGELGVRAALGAGRGRLLRQLLAESVVLAAAGGALGCLLASWEMRLLEGFWSNSIPGLGGWARGWFHLRLDGRVLGLTFLLCLVAGTLAGLLPARAATRADLTAPLRGLPQAAARRDGRWGAWSLPGMPELLVILQVALAVWLVAATGSFAQSLLHLYRTPTGFSTAGLWITSFSLPDRRPDGSPFEPRAAYLGLQREARELPGVAAASLSWGVPLSGLSRSATMRLPERPGQSFDVALSIVGDGYFATLGIPRRLGRTFAESDGDGRPSVAVVNESLARRFWPGESPIGRTILVENGNLLSPRASAEVIGVVADTRSVSPWEPPRPLLYLPFGQNFRRLMTLVTRAASPGLDLAPLIQRQIRRHHPDLAIVDLMPFSVSLDRALSGQRLNTGAVALFALLGLALAAAGVGGAMATSVSRRTREIGIRMALGAQRGQVLSHVLRRALALAAAGSLLGLGATLAGSRLLASFLDGVTATPSLLPLAAAAAILLVIAVLAALLPARRAARVDPLRAIGSRAL